MGSFSILRIERINYALAGVLVILAALTQPRPVALGLAVGAALTCLNFFVLRKLVTRWTADAAQGKSSNAALLMLPKMIGLMGAVAVAVLVLPIDVIAFIVGYSLFIVSIIIETASAALRPSPAQPDRSDEHHG